MTDIIIITPTTPPTGLVARIVALVQTIAADIKALQASIAAASSNWPFLSQDPADFAAGRPWLLSTTVLEEIPLAVRVAGFARTSEAGYPKAQAIRLCVKTGTGDVVRFKPQTIESPSAESQTVF